MPLESHSRLFVQGLFIVSSGECRLYSVHCLRGWWSLPRPPRSFGRVNCYTLSYLRLGASEFHLCLSVQPDFFWLLQLSSFKARVHTLLLGGANDCHHHPNAVSFVGRTLLFVILHSSAYPRRLCQVRYPDHRVDTGSPHLLSYTAASIPQTSRISCRSQE